MNNTTNYIEGKIYKITNRVNGKLYIGQTIRDINERIGEHKRKKNSLVGRAFHKYGIEKFDIEILETHNNIETLNEREDHWIKRLGTLVPYGYNQCYGGGNTFGYKHTKETRMKMSKNRGRYYKEENPFYKKNHTEEARRKMSEYHKGKRLTAEHIKKISESIQKKVINLDTGEVFDSIKEAAEYYNLKDTHITRVCKGKRKRTGGYRWMHYETYLNKKNNITKQLTLFG